MFAGNTSNLNPDLMVPVRPNPINTGSDTRAVATQTHWLGHGELQFNNSGNGRPINGKTDPLGNKTASK